MNRLQKTVQKIGVLALVGIVAHPFLGEVDEFFKRIKQAVELFFHDQRRLIEFLHGFFECFKDCRNILDLSFDIVCAGEFLTSDSARRNDSSKRLEAYISFALETRL